MGSVNVSSCICCMFVSCVHPVIVLNAAFCIPCSLLMLVEDAKGDHMEEGYSSTITVALDMRKAFDTVNIHTLTLWMCVLYMSFGSQVRSRIFGCVAMDSALLCILRSRLLVYSAGSGVNRVQVALSEFSMRLFRFVQAKTLCRYGCIYFLAALVIVCVDVMVISSA